MFLDIFFGKKDEKANIRPNLSESTNTYDPCTVANCVVFFSQHVGNKVPNLTHRKLQILLFVIQGIHVARFGCRLIHAEFVKGVSTPNISSLYPHFGKTMGAIKHLAKDPIGIYYPHRLAPSDQAFVENILNAYGKLSVDEIANKFNFSGNTFVGTRSTDYLSNELMVRVFSPFVGKK